MAMIRVKHVGSRPEWKTPKDGSGSWINYWDKHSRRPLGCVCRDCGETATKENPLVGAHVKKLDSIDDDIYIVPTCRNCNTTGANDNHAFKCDEFELVPANKYNL